MKNCIPYEKKAPIFSVVKTILCIIVLSGLPGTRALAFFMPVITGNPSSVTVCRGGSTSFTVAATGTGLTYQWQVFNGSSWSDITNNSQYSNATTPILAVTAITAGMSGFQYRCNVSDGAVATSAAAILTVNGNTAPAVQTINDAHTICAAGGGTLSANASTATSYQWQVSTDGGITWGNTSDGAVYSGSLSASGILNILSGVGLDGNLYHYVATDGSGCSATSAIDTLHSLSPTISSPASATSITICPGTGGTITAVASSPLALSYQWQLGSANLTDNSTYSGSTTTALTISNATTAMTNNKYKVVVTDAHSCTSTSSQVTLLVPSVSITTQPVSVTTCAGTPVTLTVAFSSTGGTPTRQWQTDNGTTAAGGPVVWTNTGSNSSSLALGTVTTAKDGFHYRVIVTSVGSCNAITSSESILHVGASGTWFGTVDTNWHEPGNWCGGVPTPTTDVLIPSWAPRMPTISPATITANWQSIKIENNATLRITGGSYPYALSPSAYNLPGTVAYIADADQYILPATHGSLTVGGSLNKLLQTNTAVTGTLTLGGSAKLVTGTSLLTMKAGSNPISGAAFGSAAGSWIVTGNGPAGAANTGLGGLVVEQVGATPVLYPIGPSTLSYNPAYISNTGTIDNFTLAVNDQPLPGSIANSGVNASWLLSEQTPGGSNIALQLQWNQPSEQSSYVRTSSQIIRSDGSAIVQYTSVLPVPGANPYTTSGGAFSVLTQFSVASYALLLPIRLTGFTARRAGVFNQIDWQVTGQEQPASYIVERSADGAVFGAIGRVTPGSHQLTYSYADKDPGNAVTYYRLAMPSPGGGTTLYSHTVTVTNPLGAIRAALRPSVTAGSETSLFIVLPQRTRLVCTLTDAIGRVQLQRSVALEKGEQTIPLSVAGLARGIYYLRIAGSEGIIKLLPLVKQ